MPTFASLCCQGRESSPICSRCSLAIETFAHIMKCEEHQAMAQRSIFLHSALQDLTKTRTPIHILIVLE
jgi:hypothetical protein